jgi:urease accessory protein UreE
MASDEDEVALHRAREAKLLMESPLLVEALREVRAKFNNDLRTVNFEEDQQALVRCRYQLDALGELELQLKRSLETGTLIVAKSEQRAEMGEFLDRTSLPAQ